MKKRSKKKFIPVMLTPFKENGEIDFDGLTTLTEMYLNAGVKGLFANCQSSEMFELSDDEKLRIVKHVTRIAEARVPIVAVGNFGKTIVKQADFIKRMYDTGVQAAIIVTGLIVLENEPSEIFEEKVFRLLELTGKIPLGFYECPEPYKRVLTAEQLKTFVATGRIIYHKDTCLDIGLVREKLKATNAYSSFGLYDAYVINAVDALKAGAAGLSCIQGNFFPELIVWLCEHYNDESRIGDLHKVQYFLKENMEVMHNSYPAAAKYCLQKSGLDISIFTRSKAGIFAPGMKDKLDRLLDQYHLLKKNIEVQELKLLQ